MDWLLLLSQPCSLPRPTCPSLQLPDHLSSPSTLFPGLNLLFQAHSFRCRLCELPGITGLNGEDSVFKISFVEFPSGWMMIWGQSAGPDLPSTVKEMLCWSFPHSSMTILAISDSLSGSMLTQDWRTNLRAKTTFSPKTGLQGNRFTVNRGGEVSSHFPL